MTNQRRWAPKRLFGAWLITMLLFAFPTLAQQQQPPPAAAPGPPSNPDEKTNHEKDTKSEEQITLKNDRLFGVLPNYTTVENEDRFGPLLARGKFKMAALSSFDPYTFPFIGFIALVGQAQNSEPSWGQGAAGYAKRYGAAYGDATIGTFMTVAIAPTLLRQDPRYYQLGQGSIFHRAKYSLSRIFITRADSGHSQFNYSEIAGNAFAAAISNAYHPAQDRSVANTLSIWGTDIMWDAVANEAKEFWPDIRRRVHKTHEDPESDPRP